MALQGTLDTFALIDVFRLLASTNKTGRLRVTGDAATATSGSTAAVCARAARNTKPSDAPVSVIFETAPRLHEGSFVFS